MSHETALIADDDEFFRMALATILTTRLGFSRVLESASMDEAVERLAEHPDVSLALFDLAMPGMEGVAGLRAVRECFPQLCTAVVSSSSARQIILQALDAGVHGFVPKSLGVVELSRALQLLLDGIIFVPPSIADLPLSEEISDLPGRGKALDPVPESLSPRQREVLRLLVRGHSNKEIARLLGLGEGTVKVHVAALFRRLGVGSRSSAAVAGARILAREDETA